MPILLDTNVFVHAAYRGSPLHGPATELVSHALRVRGAYCISPQILVEFAAVVTRERFVSPPMTAADVFRMSSMLFKSRCLIKIYPKRGTVARCLQTGTNLGITGPRWYDLFLAETMRDGGVEVVVTENVSDFRQFPFITARSVPEAADSR